MPQKLAAAAPADTTFECLAELSMQGIIVFAPTVWELLFVNDSFARLLGFDSAAEIITLVSLENIIETDDLTRLKSQEILHVKGDGPYHRSYRVRRKDGSTMDFADLVTPIFWHGETALLATSLNIHEAGDTRPMPDFNGATVDNILNNAADSIATIDAGGTILSFNRAAEQTFGYTAAEVIGKPLSLIVPEPHAARHQTYIETYLETGSSQILGHGPRDLEGCHKDGSLIPIELAISEMRANGKIYFIGTMRETSHRQLVEQAIQGAKEEAEFANRAKTNFLTTMSHELRTPLNAIIGFSEIIRDETFGPVGAQNYIDYAKDIGDSGQHLLRLIEDVLDYSKAESGNMSLDESNVDVPQAIETCLSLTREIVSRGKLIAETDIPEDLPTLWADKFKLNQVLINLFGNAAKFTEPGGKIGIRVWAKAESGYVFQIHDTGIGMALNDIPRVLEPFGQLDGALNRQYQGTGLGLPLSKRIVELHGGSFDLQSEPGKGTTVTARFPSERIRDCEI